jgi:hypothetical protein
MDERLRRPSDLGGRLEAFSPVIDFEIVQPELEAPPACGDGAKVGRPPFDPVMMFEILAIQAQQDLGDHRAEFLISERLSFMRGCRASGRRTGCPTPRRSGRRGSGSPRPGRSSVCFDGPTPPSARPAASRCREREPSTPSLARQGSPQPDAGVQGQSEKRDPSERIALAARRGSDCTSARSGGCRRAPCR